MNTSEVESLIKRAFKGVQLGNGCSLRSAESADGCAKTEACEDPLAYPDVNIENDWSALSVETLDTYPYLAYMDAEGMRYYIPAFMLSILAEPDTGMRFICTLGALYPRRGGSADYTIGRYALLNQEQRCAIAFYLDALPSLVELDAGDQKSIERALRNYWHEYLPKRKQDSPSQA
jgi:hypothetical protein